MSEQSPNQLTLLHISDLHFGPPFVPKVGETLLQKAAELHPDIVVISGDFTQRAKPEQFQAARDFLGRLPRVPHIVVPGNHDVPLYRVAERLLSADTDDRLAASYPFLTMLATAVAGALMARQVAARVDVRYELWDEVFHVAYAEQLHAAGLTEDAHRALDRVDAAGITQSVLSMYRDHELVPLVEELGIFKPSFLLSVPRVFEKVYNGAAQKAAYEGLKKQGGKGSVVALEPSTGKILALASYPSYDPSTIAGNSLETDAKAWDKLQKKNNPEIKKKCRVRK